MNETKFYAKLDIPDEPPEDTAVVEIPAENDDLVINVFSDGIVEVEISGSWVAYLRSDDLKSIAALADKLAE